jgi:hypothetical protein
MACVSRSNGGSQLARDVLRPEIPHQPFKSRLIGVVILPPSEIADVSLPSQMRRLCDRRIHDGIVYLNRCQNQAILPPLPFQCRSTSSSTSRALKADVPITVRLSGDRILPTWRLEARSMQGADWLARSLRNFRCRT